MGAPPRLKQKKTVKQLEQLDTTSRPEQREREERQKKGRKARERSRQEREYERYRDAGGMSLNQLRTGKVVREAVVKLAKSYEGPLKVRGKRASCDFCRAHDGNEKVAR